MSNKPIQSLIIIFMVFVIIIIVAFPSTISDLLILVKLNEKNSDNQDNEIKEQTLSLKDRIPFNVKLLITSFFLFVFGVFIILIGKSNKNTQDEIIKNLDREEKVKPVVANPIHSKYQYDHVTKSTTEKELEKLKRNPKFQQMLQEKGTDKKNWVWQTAEKEKKTVWREGEDTDDSNEDLSNVQ